MGYHVATKVCEAGVWGGIARKRWYLVSALERQELAAISVAPLPKQREASHKSAIMRPYNPAAPDDAACVPREAYETVTGEPVPSGLGAAALAAAEQPLMRGHWFSRIVSYHFGRQRVLARMHCAPVTTALCCAGRYASSLRSWKSHALTQPLPRSKPLEHAEPIKA
jgi:hypothetical protein